MWTILQNFKISEKFWKKILKTDLVIATTILAVERYSTVATFGTMPPKCNLRSNTRSPGKCPPRITADPHALPMQGDAATPVYFPTR